MESCAAVGNRRCSGAHSITTRLYFEDAKSRGVSPHPHGLPPSFRPV